MGQEGGDRRAEELLAVAAADDERALLARGDDHAGGVGGDRHERVVAAQPRIGAAHRLDEAGAVEVAGDQVRDHLGVGLRREDGAVGQELLLELHVVLDDAVDHDVDPVVGVEVRVRVGLRDAPVRRPARVADPGRGGRREHRDGTLAVALGHRLAQVGEVADRAHGLEPLLTLEGDACGVVAAVLELLQPVEQDLLDRAMTDVADDSAHAGGF